MTTFTLEEMRSRNVFSIIDRIVFCNCDVDDLDFDVDWSRASNCWHTAALGGANALRALGHSAERHLAAFAERIDQELCNQETRELDAALAEG